MVRLRRAVLADARRLFDWRNDAAARAASRNSGRIKWEDHIAWLKRSLANPRRKILIAEIDGEPVGRVRVDRSEAETELSWTVAPEHRGKGIGTEIVADAVPDEEVVAYIKCENIASQRIARSADFELVDDKPLQKWVRQPG